MLQVNSDAILELVDAHAPLERIASGYTFAEGPIWHPSGYLLFSDVPGDSRHRWEPEAGVSTVARPTNKGNGMTLDNEGQLVVCEHSTSSLVRMDPDGSGARREILANTYNGKELNSPNDVIVGDDGSIYFTDPGFGRLAGVGVERDQVLEFQGVFRLPPAGADLQLVAGDFGQPNGLCFSPDRGTLYVNDTTRAQIRALEIATDGSVTRDHVFAANVGSGDLAKGDVADGMKVDARGNVWVTGTGGILVFTPDADLIGVIEVPENVGNMNWGGPNWDWLLIAASTSVYRLECKVAGNRLPYMGG